MKGIIYLLSIVLVFHILIIFPNHALAEENGSSDLIEKTCKQTQFYDLCITSLKSDPRSSTADLNGLESILLDQIMAKAKDDLNYVKDLAGKTTEIYMRRYLDTCVQLYTFIVTEYISVAIKSLKAKDYETVNRYAGGCSNDAETCEDEFGGGEPYHRKSPLTDRNAFMHDICGVATEIAYVLLKG